jgi:tetratricopeptide (TPR) repeat protein
MNARNLPVPAACFSALILFAGCASLQVSGYVQRGRNALHAGAPATAVSYLRSAADLDPNYHTPGPLHGSVLTYLGRAYYETGNLTEARTVLEKALANDKEDYMAGFYLGLLRLRGGDQDSGRREVETGLKRIYAALESLSTSPYQGIFWDPGRTIRSKIQTILSDKITSTEFLAEAEWIGRQLDEEIEKAQRDEVEDRYFRGSDGM